MLNIINSFQNKGYPKTLFHNSYSTNNIKIKLKKNLKINQIMITQIQIKFMTK